MKGRGVGEGRKEREEGGEKGSKGRGEGGRGEGKEGEIGRAHV